MKKDGIHDTISDRQHCDKTGRKALGVINKLDTQPQSSMAMRGEIMSDKQRGK